MEEKTIVDEIKEIIEILKKEETHISKIEFVGINGPIKISGR